MESPTTTYVRRPRTWRLANLKNAWLPRDLHPGAWWLWALGLAVAASCTTNPILLALIIAACTTVVVTRRSRAPWALSYRLYLLLGMWIVIIRVAFRVVFGGGQGTTVLVHIPTIPLPSWVAGIQLFGPITAESLYGGFTDGLRLATMVIALGAANALANPKRLLKSLPKALHEIATAVIIAVSMFPQLADSVQRVTRARKLRGGTTKRRQLLTTVAVPVLEDAFDRSIKLAASMDARGYGRSRIARRNERVAITVLTVGGLCGIGIGVFATLNGDLPRLMATPVLLVAFTALGAGAYLSGRQVPRVRYRPDRWLLPELAVTASGLGIAVVFIVSPDVTLQLASATLTMPTLTLGPLIGIAIALLPAAAAPLPESLFAEATR